MSARRIVLRRERMEQHPPQFNRTARARRLELQISKRIRPRMTFGLWMLKTFFPARYAELEARALGDQAKKVEKQTEQRDADEARQKFAEVVA